MAGDRASDEPGTLVFVALAGAVAAISTAAAVIRLAAPLDAALIAAARVSVTVLALGLVARRATAEAWRVLGRSRRALGSCVLAGVCLAAHFATWIASLGLTSVVRSVALVSTQPLFAGLVARALGDRAPPRLYLGTLIAIAGTVIMVDPGAAARDSASLLGDGLALIGAVTAAVYLALGRAVHRELGDELPVEGYFVLVNLTAAACLWVFALTWAWVGGVALWPAGAEGADLLALIWLGLVPGLIGHGALNWAVRRVPVHVVSLAVLVEPVGAAGIAYVVLGEAVGPREALGALALLVGVALGLPRRASAV